MLVEDFKCDSNYKSLVGIWNSVTLQPVQLAVQCQCVEDESHSKVNGYIFSKSMIICAVKIYGPFGTIITTTD